VKVVVCVEVKVGNSRLEVANEPMSDVLAGLADASACHSQRLLFQTIRDVEEGATNKITLVWKPKDRSKYSNVGLMIKVLSVH
jgi:hypothetical protein